MKDFDARGADGRRRCCLPWLEGHHHVEDCPNYCAADGNIHLLSMGITLSFSFEVLVIVFIRHSLNFLSFFVVFMLVNTASVLVHPLGFKPPWGNLKNASYRSIKPQDA